MQIRTWLIHLLPLGFQRYLKNPSLQTCKGTKQPCLGEKILGWVSQKVGAEGKSGSSLN